MGCLLDIAEGDRQDVGELIAGAQVAAWLLSGWSAEAALKLLPLADRLREFVKVTA